jgi:hypothetical protein
MISSMRHPINSQTLSEIPGLNFTDLPKYLIIKKRISKMKRYNSEDYFSVINKNTGKKIADCAQQEDALMLVSFDPQNRSHYNK